MIVKVHDLPTRVTILDDNNNLSSRDMIIEQDVLPEVVGAFGVFPETAYWANVREVYRTASVRLAFRAEGLKDSPRTVVPMGARLKVEYPVSAEGQGRISVEDAGDYTGQRGVKMRRGAGSAEIRTIGQPNTTPVEAPSSVPTATASTQRTARRAQ